MIEQTANIRNFFAKMDEIEAGINDGKPNMGLVWGEYGRGKTTALALYVSQKPQVRHLRAKAKWTSAWVLEDILRELELDTNGRARDRYERIIEHLTYNPTILMIDEMNLVMHNKEMVEMLRDIHDLSNNNPIVLCGTDEIQVKAKRYGSLWDRLRVKVGFKSVSREDVELFAKGLDVEIEQGTAELIAKQSGSIRVAQRTLDLLNKKALANGIESVDMKTFKSMKVGE